MADVQVWDERDDYTACTWRSTLMVIVASGFTAFPLGAYTVEEARAFRGGDARLNFSGPVEHALSRYGITVQSPAPFSQAGLREALSVPGRAYAVAGKTANFPAGHSIRRWDPVFSGFHAVCVIPLGGGLCRWLDPLAYTGFAGDQVSVADIVDTFAAGNYPNDARYLPFAVEDDVNLKGTPIEPGNWRTVLTADAGFTEDPTAMPYNNLRVLPKGTPFTVDWIVDGPRELSGTYRWYGGWVTAQPPTYPTPQWGYVISAACGPLVRAGFTQTDIDKAVTDALALPPPAPAPAPAPAPSVPAGVDIAGALAALNAIPTQTNRISLARSEIVRLKNLAKTALGG